MGAYRRNPWTPEEDERLIQAVQSHGTDGGWTKIGGLLTDRTAKQCRERYRCAAWRKCARPAASAL
jgi:hypothetical protein